MGELVTSCPSCGEDQELRSWGLDALHDGELWLQWIPCCLDARDRVGRDGWARVWGEPLVATLRRELQLPVVQVTTEQRLILEPPGGAI